MICYDDFGDQSNTVLKFILTTISINEQIITWDSTLAQTAYMPQFLE